MTNAAPILGVVAALPAEAACFRRAQAGTGPRLQEAVQVRVSGIGWTRAARAASALLDQGATALVSWGFAGALSTALAPGVLVLAERVYDIAGCWYAADAAWLERLHEVAAPALTVTTGALLTTTAIIRDSREKERLQRTFGAVAVDMESAAICAVARERHVPFIAVRSISDRADQNLPAAALNAVDETGRIRLAQALAGALGHPREFPMLLQLAATTGRARRTLRSLAQIAGNHLRVPEYQELAAAT